MIYLLFVTFSALWGISMGMEKRFISTGKLLVVLKKL
jgi:hypothetical protein